MGFPGLYRPGLIGAASLAAANAAGKVPVSGALPPRPHWSLRGGLKDENADTVSGALPPRPHWSDQVIGGVRLAAQGFPGLYRPGLIGAHRLDVHGPGELRFPGLYRPGLIGASQESKVAPNHSWRWFPGLYRPGLIGARSSGAARSSASRFPGLYRPGLIGAVLDRGLGFLELLRFPGLYRPGLIGARGDRWRRGVEGRGFPGLYRPGLIGASSEPASRLYTRTVSGALPPRPHWSGG